VSPLSELECRIVSFFLHARNLECLEEPQWLKQARGSGNTLLESGDWSNDEDLDIPSTLQLDYRIVEVERVCKHELSQKQSGSLSVF
jgi:hypothetical protein